VRAGTVVVETGEARPAVPPGAVPARGEGTPCTGPTVPPCKADDLLLWLALGCGCGVPGAAAMSSASTSAESAQKAVDVVLPVDVVRALYIAPNPPRKPMPVGVPAAAKPPIEGAPETVPGIAVVLDEGGPEGGTGLKGVVTLVVLPGCNAAGPSGTAAGDGSRGAPEGRVSSVEMGGGEKRNGVACLVGAGRGGGGGGAAAASGGADIDPTP
jgi:hypothetical protein